jgi:hypothetical protein
MTDNDKALKRAKLTLANAVLEQAQALLVERLAEYISDNDESFLESFSGPDLGMHNEVFELADKLREINLIISVMPHTPPGPESYSTQVQSFDGAGGQVVVTPPQLTLGGFVTLVEEGKFEQAAGVLSHLFGISVVRARDCTRFFADKWAKESDTFEKAMLIPVAVYQANESSYQLLNELFDLGGAEITNVIRASRHTLGQAT